MKVAWTKILFWLPLCILILSIGINLSVSARASDVGSNIQKIENKTKVLSLHNEEMMRQLASKEALTTLISWADQHGFIAQ